jgi:hypothetical protein
MSDIYYGHDEMCRWNATWKRHHIPIWVKKAIRMKAIQDGKWSGRHDRFRITSFFPDGLIDHHGSIKRGSSRVFITQPYCKSDDVAKAFAKEMGWSVECITPAPWGPGTRCYTFAPIMDHGTEEAS